MNVINNLIEEQKQHNLQILEKIYNEVKQHYLTHNFESYCRITIIKYNNFEKQLIYEFLKYKFVACGIILMETLSVVEKINDAKYIEIRYSDALSDFKRTGNFGDNMSLFNCEQELKESQIILRETAKKIQITTDKINALKQSIEIKISDIFPEFDTDHVEGQI